MTRDKTRNFDANDPSLARLLESQSFQAFGTASLGNQCVIALNIQGYKEFIRLSEGQHIELGRFEFPEQHQLNLSPYGALENGISRVHAQLHLLQGRLFIADMDSSNGTYVHGKRLDPADPTLLRNGDDILLGRMAINITF
ncbi:MAG: FHA domain-containing protein [Chloroflexota bacterium]